jgi:16S rRNA (guanine966-N2)-methyltransferase
MSVSGMRLRPTSDRLRETIFNILSQLVKGAHVLDLFAGTGAMGIESLSRGAESATFVDNHLASVKIIQKNLDNCRLLPYATVLRWDASRNLNCIKDLRFNLTFLDPPYNRRMIAPALNALYKTGCMVSGALIVVEHSLAESIPEQYQLLDQRKYGKTIVSFINFG